MSLWRKRGTSDTVATDVHHNEQKPDHLVNIVTNLSIQSDDLSIKSEEAMPVCDKDPQGCWNVRCQLGKKCKNTPPQRTWVGLTDEELEQLSNKWRIIYGGHVGDFAREVEAKLKEKNT